MKKKVIAHLKGDIKDFKKEAAEDRALIKELSSKKKKHVKKRSSKKKKDYKFKKVMHEFKEHALHSGSKKGPVVSNPKQAVAIAYSEQRRAKKRKKVVKKKSK